MLQPAEPVNTVLLHLFSAPLSICPFGLGGSRRSNKSGSNVTSRFLRLPDAMQKRQAAMTHIASIFRVLRNIEPIFEAFTASRARSLCAQPIILKKGGRSPQGVMQRKASVVSGMYYFSASSFGYMLFSIQAITPQGRARCWTGVNVMQLHREAYQALGRRQTKLLLLSHPPEDHV